MGILNITPDSFSDGGQFNTPDAAFCAARTLVDQGADILDIGGESTRPGADPVTIQDELSRVIPVIQAIKAEMPVALSIDTCKPEVAEAALEAGADIVNDVSGFRDPEMIKVCAAGNCGLVAMHMKGTPQTMQNKAVYQNVVSEVRGYFEERYRTLMEWGIPPDRIICDPGIGFGKILEHNLALLRDARELTACSRPFLIGLSRKSLIAQLLDSPEISQREAPTQALTSYMRACGAMVHRVHDVKSCREALRMTEAIMNS